MMSDFKTRSEKSLGILATKFVSLLRNSPNGVLDLKAVSWSISFPEVHCLFNLIFMPGYFVWLQLGLYATYECSRIIHFILLQK